MRVLPLPGVFQPHSDSLMLADCVRRERLRPGARVLDLCTGSGVLAVVAASRGAEVTAVDVSRRAVLAARINARLNGVSLEAVRGDLFSAVEGRRFDVIVSNPPYLPGSAELPASGRSRAWEGGPRGRIFIDRICVEAAGHLSPDGVLLLVHSTVCGERETMNALRRGGLVPSVIARHHGPLGPRLRARSAWLRERGLIGASDQEEIIVIRALRSSRPR